MKHRTALAGLSALAVTSGLLLGSPASADPSPSSAAGASWLDDDLAANGPFASEFGVDVGLNLDAGFALVQAGDDEAAAAQRTRLAPSTDGYITGEAFGDAGSTYGNAVAKLLAFVVESGGDPTSYDGKNLVTRLEAQVGTGQDGTTAGQIFDTSEYGSYTNVLGQAFAAQGLSAVDSAKADAVTDHLLAQQCADGHFPLDFRTSETDTCDDAGNPDIAALVLVALRDQVEDPAVAAAIRKAATFISSRQAADGSVGGTPPTDAPNANTTGLSAWALGEACVLDGAYRAAEWTRTLQIGSQSGPELAGEAGAIAYDPAALARDKADGIGDNERDQYRRSTAQAANGLAYDADATPTVTLAGPGSTYVKGGSQVTLRVGGISEGDAPCLQTPTGGVMLSDDASTVSTAVTVPAATGVVRFGATTGPGLSTTTVKVLGAKKIPLSSAKQVRRGRLLRVELRGLAARENVRVFFAGQQVTKRVAGTDGKVVVRFKVGKKVGLGAKKVRVVGQFGNRVGTRTVRVLANR